MLKLIRKQLLGSCSLGVLALVLFQADRARKAEEKRLRDLVKVR